MKSIRNELVQYGTKIIRALGTSIGGSISARAGDKIWIQPDELAMDEMRPADFCGIELKAGRQIQGKNRPAPEVHLHRAIYLARPDIAAVFHTHSAWVIGAISAGKKFRPMFAEFVNDLGRTGSVPYLTPESPSFTRRMVQCAKDHDTIFMINHGLLALGVNLKQAFYRCVVSEDAAKSLFAASLAGKPLFFNKQRVDKILSLDAVQERIKMMEKK
ncbi:MAG: class II aldolase/adducin family protein [Kiritimatiellia bacterium]|nr:class II aldolase/adducin family protein [Kiritimatiellia bacterium]